MPEIAEVETVARSLRRRLRGRRIRRVEIHDPKLARLDVARLRGRVVRDVFRAGKEIIIDLSTPRAPLWWGIHLRMTGAPHWSADGRPPTAVHLRLSAWFDRGALFYFDSRRFGVMRLCTAREEWEPTGVDPLSPAFTRERLAGLLRGSRTAIKPWLLRQDKLAGFGNIYASEVLYVARLNPRRAAGSLRPDEVDRLYRATRQVLTKAVECGGTTISDFADCDGACGGYQSYLKVYGRAGERCRRCPGTVRRIVQQGRSTFYCPDCQ